MRARKQANNNGVRAIIHASNNLYSIDMPWCYVSIFKPKIKIADMAALDYILDAKRWGSNDSPSELYSPSDVLANPDKYPADMEHIRNVDLNSPIMFYNGQIIDGVYRVCKARLLKKRGIAYHAFNNQQMKKFLINIDGDMEKV